jgi:sulfate permease, SulP family
VLVPYGSLFYASAPLFKEQLPVVSPDTRHAVVILGLRDEDNVGSTFLQVAQAMPKPCVVRRAD